MRRTPIIVNRNKRNRLSPGPIILDGIEYPLVYHTVPFRTDDYGYGSTSYPDPTYTYSLTITHHPDDDTDIE